MTRRIKLHLGAWGGIPECETIWGDIEGLKVEIPLDASIADLIETIWEITGYSRCPVVQQASAPGSRRKFDFELRYKEKKMTSLKHWGGGRKHEHSHYALKKVECLLDSNDNRQVQEVFLDNRQMIRVLCYDENGYPLVYVFSVFLSYSYYCLPAFSDTT